MVFWLGFAALAFGSVKNLYHKAVVYNSAWHKLPEVLHYLRYCNTCIQHKLKYRQRIVQHIKIIHIAVP